MKLFAVLFLLVAGIVVAGPVLAAEEQRLTLTLGGMQPRLSAAELLALPDARTVDILHDPGYARPMRYHAVPLAALLKSTAFAPGQVVEAVAADGFVAQLPLEALLHPSQGGAEAFLAVEPPDHPWPPLPGKKTGAGPFYIVWLHPEAGGIRSEQWPYGVVELRAAESQATRWPALALDPDLPAKDPVRLGQAVFATQCMTCHKLNGAGSADVGPDLNKPQNPVEYFQPRALKAYIRNPAGLRRWPAMQMKGFDKDALSDHEIDLIVTYLQYVAAHRTAH